MYIPTFLERTSYGERETNPYSMLFEGRIVLVDRPLEDATANAVVAQLLCLESTDPDRPIEVYLNSPGGTIPAMTAVYDTMQFVRSPVHTTCLGHVETVGAVLLAAGTPGHRAIVPNAQIALHQPALDPVRGTMPDLHLRATEVTRNRLFLETTLAAHTGRTVEQVHADIERENHLGAADAQAYGLVDAVVGSRKLQPVG